MRITVLHDIPDDPVLQRQWNALVQKMEHPEVFYTHQWALAVSRSFGQLIPMLVLGYDGEELVGVVALAIDAAERTATFLCGTSADYCDLLSHPDRRAEFLDALLVELRRADLSSILLTSIPAESATIMALKSAARRHGLHLFVRPTADCAQVELGNQEQRAVLKATLEKKKMFRRNINILEKEGPVSFDHVVTWNEISPLLETFSLAHVARFLATGRISNIVNAQRRAFLSELARLLAESGWLALSQMSLAGRAIAWNYGFQFHGSWFWYQPTFDTAYERLSPGYCLLSKIISQACETQGTRVVDLGLGAEGYKERFANGTRSTLHATLEKSIVRHGRGFVRFHAARIVKSIPVAESMARLAVGNLRRVGQECKKTGVKALPARGTKLLTRRLSSRQEYLFYQWVDEVANHNPERRNREMSLRPVTLEALASAAMCYEDEEDTLAYLLRSAARLQKKEAEGFALLDEQNIPVHFGWVAAFEGFEMGELSTRLSAPSQSAAMIFDCWTPRSRRGRGYYSLALSLAAEFISNSGREPWLFSAASNHSSRRGIEKAGFEPRYLMVCRKMLARRRVSVVAFERPSPTEEKQAHLQV